MYGNSLAAWVSADCLTARLSSVGIELLDDIFRTCLLLSAQGLQVCQLSSSAPALYIAAPDKSHYCLRRGTHLQPPSCPLVLLLRSRAHETILAIKHAGVLGQSAHAAEWPLPSDSRKSYQKSIAGVEIWCYPLKQPYDSELVPATHIRDVGNCSWIGQ